MKKTFYILMMSALVATSTLLPLSASAQTPPQTQSSPNYQFQTAGITGCNQTGAAASSVGAFSASGSYVPVSDAAVELNTGYLVYLACSLNPLVSSLSQSATAGLVVKALKALTNGNAGGPQYSVNLDAENLNVANSIMVSAIQGGAFSTLNPALRGNIQTRVVQSFAASTQQPNAVLSCPYSGDLTALLNGQTTQTSLWAGLSALQNPACNPLGAYQLSNDLANGYVANAIQNNNTELQWGNGVYPIIDANGNVLTPGAIILSQANQALGAGFQKTEDAVSIGQMVTALFAGIGTQAISSAQGLFGITQPEGGQPSYIDQVAAAASQGVVTSIVNTTITDLISVQTTVNNYIDALTSMANTFTQTILSLRAKENECWNSIIDAVCVAGSIQVSSNGVETCTQVPPATTSSTQTSTSTPPITLKIATSTKFSDMVIQSGNPSINSQGLSVASQIKSAQGSLASVNQLISDVSATTSPDVRSAAIVKVDALTASSGFPSPFGVNTVKQQATSLATSMSTLLSQTEQTWDGVNPITGLKDSWDGTFYPGTGWCNYNDQRTQTTWELAWKQTSP